MSKIAAWLQAARPLAHVNVALPLLLGQALAFAAHRRFELWALGAVAAFGILDHLFIVFANDVADETADRQHPAPTFVSGGSRVLPEGKLSSRQLSIAAGAAFAGLSGLTLVLALGYDRPLAPLAALAAAALLWAYSFPPARLSYRGHGELLQGLGLGVVLPAFGFYVQAGTLTGLEATALWPLFVLGVAGNLLTSLPDHTADLAVGKASYPVRHGQAAARSHAIELIASALVFTPWVVPGAPAWCVALAVGFPMGVLASALDLRATADADRPGECITFVMLVSAAHAAVLVGWGAAAALSNP